MPWITRSDTRFPPKRTTMALGARLNHVTAWNSTKRNATPFAKIKKGLVILARNLAYASGPAAMALIFHKHMMAKKATERLVSSRSTNLVYRQLSNHHQTETRRRYHLG